MSTIIFYFSAWIVLGLLSQVVSRTLHNREVLAAPESYFWSAVFGPITFILFILSELLD